MSSEMTNEGRVTIKHTSYEVQNWSDSAGVAGRWEMVVVFGSQEAAEQCLHRTDGYEVHPPLITMENPRWRIVRVEQIERTMVVLRVSAVNVGNSVVRP